MLNPATEAEIGEVLFGVVALARSLDIDAEDALRLHARRFAATARDHG